MNDNFNEESVEDIINMFGSDSKEISEYAEIFERYGLDIKKLEDEMKDYRSKITLVYEKIHEDSVDPKYNYPEDSGFDLHTVEEIIMEPFGRALAPTGLKFDVPENHEIQVRSKSGLAINQGLMVLNSPGTVDKSYKGEIKVILFNTNNKEIVIPKGMKVGQAVLCPVACGKLVNLAEDKVNMNTSDRKDKGFGSTGI